MKIDDHRQLRAFIAAIAPLGLLASGCSGGLGDFDGEICILQPDALSELSPAEGTDYVAIRSLPNADIGAESASLMTEWGQACATAGDPTACLDALDNLPTADPALWSWYGQIRSSYDLIYTQGDEVGRIVELAGLLDILGPVDTPAEAALVVHAEGHAMPCGENNWRRERDSFVLLGMRGHVCGGNGVYHYELFVGPDGNVVEGDEDKVADGDPNCAIGRRPDGLCSRTRMAQQVGEFFANAAHLEAASVYAFGHLARELAAHRAPRSLVRAAWRARSEEIRHARVTAALARRFGARPVRPVVRPRPVRRLFDVAMDNGTEGCVRETFGAVAATVQAESARHPAIRGAMRSIAADETRHAALSWAIDAWAQSKLRPAERRAIAEGREAAVRELQDEASHRWAPSIRDLAGMPGPEAAARLLAPLTRALWS